MDVLRRDLHFQRGGTAASVMVGVGETYFPAFVLATSGSQLACGLVTTVPLVIGPLLQLTAPALLGRMRSYRRWVALCAGLQAAAFLVLAWGAARNAFPLAVTFALVAIYWGTGWAAGRRGMPGWRRSCRRASAARYFGCTCAANWGIAAGFVGGGLLLHLADDGRHLLPAFAVLFLAAAASRFVSTSLWPRSAKWPAAAARADAAAQRLDYFLTQAPNRRLLLYLLAAAAAVQVAGPCFQSLYPRAPQILLRRLRAADGGRIRGQDLLPAGVRTPGRRIRAKTVFWASTLLVIPLPVLWLVSSNFLWLLVVQVLSGGIWAAYELTMLLLFFETIPGSQRVALLTLFNLGNAAAIVGGSLLGGALLAALGDSTATYATLFILSSLARAVASGSSSACGRRRLRPPPHRPTSRTFRVPRGRRWSWSAVNEFLIENFSPATGQLRERIRHTPCAVCRRHTECAGYFAKPTLISPILTTSAACHAPSLGADYILPPS